MLGGFADPADLLSKPGLPVTGCVNWGKFINLSEHGFTQLSNDDDYPRDCDKNQRSSSIASASHGFRLQGILSPPGSEWRSDLFKVTWHAGSKVKTEPSFLS